MKVKSDPNRVLVAMCLAAFLVPFMGSSMNLALPQLVEDFSMSAVTLTFTVSSYLLTTAVFQMPAARMADILGRKRVFLTGLCTFTAFLILCALAWSPASLIFFRLMSGVGSAMVFGTNMAILSDVFPPKERGRALGINTAVVYASVAIGPVVGGLLAHHWGWRAIFLVCAAWALMPLAMTWVWVKDEWRNAEGEPFDYLGSAIFAVSLAGFILGCSFLPGPAAWPLLIVGAAGAALFIKAEQRTDYPVINLELFFSNRHFRLSSLSALINYSASFALGFILSLYLQYVKGLDARTAGLFLVIQPLVQTVFSPYAGKLSDRVNPSILTTSGMGIITVALVVLTGLHADSPLILIGIILAVLGLGFAIFSSPNVNIIMGSVSKRYYSLASATTGTARLIGQSMSLAIATMAIHVHMGDAEMSLENSGMFMASMKTALLIFAALCAAGVYTSASKILGKYAKEDWRAHSSRQSARTSAKTSGRTSKKSSEQAENGANPGDSKK